MSTAVSEGKPYQDQAWLSEMVVRARIPIATIAEFCKVEELTILRWIVRLKIIS